MDPNPPLPDFDTLLALHRSDPLGYEILRMTLLNACVAGAPASYQVAAKSVMLRIEQVRVQHADPVEAALAAARLMIASVLQLQAPMDELMEEMATFQICLLMKRLRATR